MSRFIEKWETSGARTGRRAGKLKKTTTLSWVPKTLPAAACGRMEISARAAAVGFDWARAADVMDKIEE